MGVGAGPEYEPGSTAGYSLLTYRTGTGAAAPDPGWDPACGVYTGF